ncbi:MAG: stage II sporulation protein E, partial [Candidatus Zixiibacteriota bacterium]
LLEERQEKQVIEAELARASTIQKNLIPTELPHLDGYQIYAYQHQCRAVGGDLYDVTCLPDGRLLLMLADVSGKGMGAALLMANILASFRVLYRQPQFDPVTVVGEVSRQLFRYSAPGDFATLFLGILDPATNRLHYVNAGHNPPYLMRPDGGYEELPASGTMIGAFDMMTWSEATAPFGNGDMLCVFTDGVTEAEKEDGEQYGEDRVVRVLKAHVTEAVAQAGEALVRDVRQFVEGAPQSDDITLLMLKRE